MRTLIVDDEAPARARLRRLLADIEGVEIIGEAADGVQAVEAIEALSPDLVLLDIQMPGLDGFEVIEALDDLPPIRIPSAIVFVTAYDQYAIRAFEVHALDYLLKPFSRQRLERAVRRAQGALAEQRDAGVNVSGKDADRRPAQLGLSLAERFATQYGPLLQELAAQGRHLTRLAVRDRDRIRVLDVDDVDYINILEERVLVHVGDRAYPIRRTLTELQIRLDPACFFRAHRSAIVNLDRVQEVIPWFKGSHILRLTTGAEVDLSRSRARALRQILDW